MYRRIILVQTILALFIGCYSDNNCKVLKNAEVTMLNGDTGITIINIEDENQNLDDAYKITIQNQRIPIICKQSIQNMNKLESLVIDASGVEILQPGAFQNLASLRNLIITSNDIEVIEKGVFGDLLIRKLNLSGNLISNIKPSSFENMLNLEVLDLSSNKLTTFENNWFKYTPKLYRLDFMYNEIASIPENAFANIIKDKYKKSDLELWFSHNAIETIHKNAFYKIDKIEDLWLNNNSLTNIDIEVFAKVQQIRMLFLDHNQLTSCDDQFLKSLNVKELDIDRNPMDCTCIDKIKEWGKQKNVNINVLSIKLNCALQRVAILKNKNE